MSDRSYVEWAPFRVKPGVDDDRVLAASAALQEQFVARQRGFRHRQLLRGPGDQWVDLVHWDSHADAQAAMAAAAESSVCALYFGLMQEDTASAGAGVLHFEIREAYGTAARA